MATRKPAPNARLPRIEKERLQFKELLLGNPNYFGGAAVETKLPVVKKMAGNPKYESISCVGYDPDHKLLEASLGRAWIDRAGSRTREGSAQHGGDPGVDPQDHRR